MADPTDEPVNTTPADPAIFAGARSPDDVVLAGLDGKPWYLTDTPTPRKRPAWPRNASFSPFKVKLVYTCLKKFHWRYRAQRPDPQGPEAVCGKLVHGAYQDALLRRLGKREIPRSASVEELLFLLNHQPAQIATEEKVLEILPTTLEDAREIVKKAGAQDFSGCYAAEHTMTIQVSRGLTIGGYIDRIDLLGPGAPENPELVLVWDYKATFEDVSEDDLWYDPQAGLYMAWARRRWPNARTVRFRLQNLRQGKRTEIDWSPNLDAFALNYAASAFHLSNTGDQTATPGEHCRYCPYREGDARHAPCEAYQSELEKTRFTENLVGGLDRLELPDLMRRHKSASGAEKLQEGAKKDTKAVILTKLGKKSSYTHGDLQAVVSHKKLSEFDMLWEFLHELAGALDVSPKDALRDFFKIRKEELDARIEALPDERKALAEGIVEKYQTLATQNPSLTVKRIKALF